MQTADFNHEDFEQGNQNRADQSLLVRFFHKTRKKKDQVAGAVPEFEEVVYVEIRIAGHRDPQACRPATPADINRFPRHHEAFMKRVEMPEEGFPLVEWPLMNRTMVEELSFMSIKTVEQLANLNDSALNFQGASTFKRKAVEWLEERNSNSALASENAELKTVLETQADMIFDMQEQIKSMAEKINAPAVESRDENALTSALDKEAEPEVEANPEAEAKPKTKPKAKRRSRAKT